MIKLKTSEFEAGVDAPERFPGVGLPEIAFAGRSNVGKSSLINFLLRRKGLAKVGKTPGKTRQVNFFLVNETFRLVDLPGFGHARVSKSERKHWEKLIDAYFVSKRPIAGVIHLIDARHPDQEFDRMMAEYLDELGLRRLLVASKVDKLKKSQRQGAMDRIVANHGYSPVMASCGDGIGRDEIWRAVEGWLGD